MSSNSFENTEEWTKVINKIVKDSSAKVTKEDVVGADEKEDMVNHPSHYISESGLEVIDVIEAFTAGLDGGEAFCIGNALKYLCRWKNKENKDVTEDLRKAIWYIQRVINKQE